MKRCAAAIAFQAEYMKRLDLMAYQLAKEIAGQYGMDQSFELAYDDIIQEIKEGVDVMSEGISYDLDSAENGDYDAPRKHITTSLPDYL